ncbi:MAG: hypothetical protein AMS20_06100 [Gemmatimonas sp. SG8_28]|nr:MAG: hypothetical protein AMS20_06100 [Gemmatimonas sp. SG8_28]
MRLLEARAPELDLAVPADLRPEHRRLPEYPTIEHDSHEVTHVLTGFLPESASAGTRQGEEYDRLVVGLVEGGPGVLQLLAGDHGPALDGVQRSIRASALGDWLAGPDEIEPAGDEPLDRVEPDEAVRPGVVLLGYEKLARDAAVEQQCCERSRTVEGRRGVPRCAVGRPSRIGAKQLFERGRLGRALAGCHTGLDQGPIDRGQLVAEPVVHVGEAPFEEGGPLHDCLGSPWLGDPRQLHDDPIRPHPLDERLRDTEFVDARADHGECAFERIIGVGDGAGTLVDLEGQVDATEQVEPALQGNALYRDVAHRSIRSPLTDGDVAGDQRQKTADHEQNDDDQAASYSREHVASNGMRRG